MKEERMFLPVWETNYSIKWPNPRRKLMRKVVNVEEGPEVGLSPHINSSPPSLSTFLPSFYFLFVPFTPYTLPSSQFLCYVCLLCLPLPSFASPAFLCLCLPFSAFLCLINSPSSAFFFRFSAFPLSSSAFRCLPLPSAAFRCLPLPSVAFRCLPLPSSAFLCLPLPSAAIRILPLPSTAFLCLPLSSNIFHCLLVSSIVFLYLSLPSSALFFFYLPFPWSAFLSFNCFPHNFASYFPFLLISFRFFLSFLSPPSSPFPEKTMRYACPLSCSDF